MQALRTRSNSAFRLIYHLVLVTKFRRKSLNQEILSRMEIIVQELLRKWECDLIEFGGEADHIHILLETHPEGKYSQTCQPLPRAGFTDVVILDYLCDKTRSWHPQPINYRLLGITDKGWQV